MVDSFSVGTNFLGSTTRPADGRTPSGTADTWMVDCTSPTAEDGSELSAEFFNEMLANVRALARGNGNLLGGAPVVADDSSDAKLITSVLNLIQRGKMLTALDNGSANLLNVVLTPPPAELISGMSFNVKKVNQANSTAMEVAINNSTPMPLIWGDGNALAGGDYPASSWGKITLDATNPEAPFCTYESMPGPSIFARVSGGVGHGQCRFVLGSATSVALNPRGGNAMIVGGASIRLPSGGVSAATTGVYVNGVAAQNLAASTAYYVALAVVSGTPVLRFWNAGTYGHMPDTTAGNIGVEVISNGGAPISTDTLVGMVWVNASTQFSDADGVRYLLSWFNRRRKTSVTTFSANRSTSSNTFVELGTEIRNGFLCWADESIEWSFNSSYTSNSSSSNGAQNAISFDGGAAEPTQAVIDPYGYSSQSSVPISFTGFKGSLTEDVAHYATVMGSVQGNTGTWYDANVYWGSGITGTALSSLSLTTNG